MVLLEENPRFLELKSRLTGLLSDDELAAIDSGEVVRSRPNTLIVE